MRRRRAFCEDFCGESSNPAHGLVGVSDRRQNWLGLVATPPFAERFYKNRIGIAASFRRRPVRLAARQPHREHRTSPLSKIVARQTYICRMLEAAVQAAVQATKISDTSHGASARCSDGNACIGRPVQVSQGGL
jgi:hypothetical protein